MSFSNEFFDGFDLAWLDFELGLGWIFQWWCWDGFSSGAVGGCVVLFFFFFLRWVVVKWVVVLGCSAWLVVVFFFFWVAMEVGEDKVSDKSNGERKKN